MNIFGFSTIDAIVGLIMVYLWGIFFGSLIGLLRFILFGLVFRAKKPYREGVRKEYE
jgi:hypothetical protein